jgi:hypothetical protein
MDKLLPIAVFSTAFLMAVAAGPAPAQQKSSGGVVCWKDKSGKTVGCGDKVPPEYQDNAATTLDKRGVAVKETDAALTPEQKKAQAAAVEQKKIDAQKREEEKRRDHALLDSFSNEKEIDLKRARDIQQMESGVATQELRMKSLIERQNEKRSKMDALKKENKPVPVSMQQDFDRRAADLAKIQAQIPQKRKEIADKNLEYDAMKKRYLELKSGASATAAAPAPAKK